MAGASESVSFDRIAERYDETRGGEERGRRWAAFLDPYFADGGRALEMGVGTGVVARAFHDRGRPVVGVDISAGMLRYAIARLGPRVARGDVQRLPIASAAVRNVYSAYVLHLVGDLRAALAEAARVLEQGGRYLVLHNSPRGNDEISRIIGEVRAGLGRAQGTTTDAITAGAAAVGFEVADVVAEPPFAFAESPAAAAASIEAKTFSWTWDVAPEVWVRHVEPAVATLRHMPDPDAPLARTTSNDLIVLRRR